MTQVRVTATRAIDGAPATVFDAVADYLDTRPRILTDHYADYEVRAGGHGAGTTVRWTLRPTRKRVRDCVLDVSQPTPNQLVERDSNSSMVTTWTVRPAGADRSEVEVETTWQGTDGVAGFFERTFAPIGMRAIYQDSLGKLAEVITTRE